MVVTNGDASAAQARALRKWKFLFDRAYQVDRSPFSGWISSYTGQPIPLPEMEEWLDTTVDRILACRPTLVLEMGCGTGLIARRVAPHVGRYCGVDISAAAIEQLRASLADASASDFRCAAAHEAAAMFEPGFDLLIVNSVVQYFTGIEYLEQVLAGAIPLLAPRGSLFIGDVRNADLDDAFAASVALSRAPNEASQEEVRAAARSLIELDGELRLSPNAIRRLTALSPRISAPRISLKSGGFDNELTRFRYDVVLRLDQPPGAPPPKTAHWDDFGASLAELESHLLRRPDRPLRVTGIGNARLTASLSAQRHLSAARPGWTARDIRQAIADDAGAAERPGSFESLGRRLGFDVEATWSESGSDRFDILFAPAGPG
jgi:SAM-dependent methyltransferase